MSNNNQRRESMEKKNCPKRRLIARLGAFLIQYAQPVSVVLCLAGFISILLLPLLAKNTYISENALMPGSASPKYSDYHTKEANDLVKKITKLKPETDEKKVDIQNLLFQHILDAGGDVYYHHFPAPSKIFRPSQFFIDNLQQQNGRFQPDERNSSVIPGLNVVGIVRAPRGDGKEAIVLVTPFQSENLKLGDALSLGLGYSLFCLFSRSGWLAKDIIWLAADSKHGSHAAVASWLRDYYQPVFHPASAAKPDFTFVQCNSTNSEGFCHDYIESNGHLNFQRAGTIAAALVLKVRDSSTQTDQDFLNIYAEATNGQMPNLDLINIVNYLAVHRQGLQTRVDRFYSIVRWKWLSFVGKMLEWIGNLLFSLNRNWNFRLSSEEYINGAAVLASSIYNQAMGIPTGAHGAFRDYQVDAITLEMLPRSSFESERLRRPFLLRLGRLTEGVVRSINNLLEKFHQSFFMYFLTSSGRFISISVYMIPFALVISPLMILAAALCSYKGTDLFPSMTTNSDDKATDHVNPVATAESKLTKTAEQHSSFQGQDVDTIHSSYQNTDPVKLGLSPFSWKWFHAAKLVVFVHLWAGAVSMLPGFISSFNYGSSEMKVLVWCALSGVGLCLGHYVLGFSRFMFHKPGETNIELVMEGWVALKAFTLGAATIGLGIMSVINYATALLGAIFLIPICLTAFPLKLILQLTVCRRSILLVLSLLFMILAFPPFSVVFLQGLFDDAFTIKSGDFWILSEMLWSWGSATYPYLFLVHIPCWVLSLYVMLYM